MDIMAPWRFFTSVSHEIERTNLGLISAGCAFFGMVAIFPAIAAIIAIFGLVADVDVVRDQLGLLRDIMPEQAYLLLARQVNSLLNTRSHTLGWASAVSILFALWSARAGVAAIMRGLNEIHGTPNRGGLRQALVALLLTVALVSVAVVSLVAVVVAPVVLAFLPLGPAATWAAEAVRWGLALAVLLIGLGILYRYGPNARGHRPKWLTPGSTFAVVTWLAASIGFSIYLTNFGNYNKVYGSIGAVIALLMWFYISAYLVLLGAVLNDMIRLRSERRKHATATR
ncbi:YihY/virulence factor BrkB family protein [Roseisalinus antarcticus]|uniref:Uncharacterized protein n=1 Tax=Roseisalinus antarcticus TaxID=254357 RepID=A0A1Y5SF38_9RHOB|nr:YihY/virulence factor BrkB family protein [Roseisalinus antarcticus]SLN39331.1 ribonuclease BN/unknown domain fusion protein [Roseisalinus antarcticus]